MLSETMFEMKPAIYEKLLRGDPFECLLRWTTLLPVTTFLFDGHRFGQVSWLINIGALEYRDMIREQL